MFKVALAQMQVIPGRPDLNSAAMLTMIQQAQAQQVELIVFPEMAIPGYLLGDTWEQPAFLRDCEEYGKQIIAASRDICVIFGNVAVDWNKAGDDGRVRKYNACFVAQNGTLCTNDKFPYPFRIKTLQPNYREFDDTRHFYSLRKLAIELGEKVENLLQPVEVTLGGKTVNLACILCEDGWCDDYCIKPISTLSENHALGLIINISNSPFTLGKNNKRNRVFSKQAAETKTPLIYVNTIGLQNNGKTVYTFDGYSTVYNAQGQVVTYCPPFAPALQVVELDLENKGDNLPTIETPDDNGIDSICAALTYGVSEFLRHVGLEKVVIGVSGGIDSAVAAALYASVLGPDKLLLANLPSVYNSDTTKNLAKQLAKNLGAFYTVVPIQQAVDLTVGQLQSAQLEGSDGTTAALTVTPFMIENIQARDRSARVLAGMSAAFGGGFTCNANKSELTVGYSTLYGDQAGFLAALGDLWKHQVYALGKYLNEQVYTREIIPQDVFDIVPSAELSSAQSVDEGKGDPLIYPYHDFLFRAFMERWNRATPEDILLWYSNNELEEQLGCERGLMKSIFKGPDDFITDLERWWKLYTGMGVAKRIQAPPILAVSRRAYGFDHREAQNQPYYTANYHKLKAQLLNANN